MTPDEHAAEKRRFHQLLGTAREGFGLPVGETPPTDGQSEEDR